METFCETVNKEYCLRLSPHQGTRSLKMRNILSLMATSRVIVDKFCGSTTGSSLSFWYGFFTSSNQTRLEITNVLQHKSYSS